MIYPVAIPWKKRNFSCIISENHLYLNSSVKSKYRAFKWEVPFSSYRRFKSLKNSPLEYFAKINVVTLYVVFPELSVHIGRFC